VKVSGDPRLWSRPNVPHAVIPRLSSYSGPVVIARENHMVYWWYTGELVAHQITM